MISQLQQIKTFYKKLVKKVVGDINFKWSAPEWIQKASLHRKKITAVSIGTVTIIAIGFVVKHYLDLQPKPEYCGVSVDSPSPTDPEKNLVHNLVINFTCSAARTELLGKSLAEGPDLSPAVNGSWKWESDKELVFTPTGEAKKGDWAVGETYKIKLSKKNLADHILIENRTIEFTTFKIDFNISKEEFYIDPRNSKIKKAVVNLRFNYPIDTEEFKKHIQFNLISTANKNLGLKGTKQPFNVSFNSFLNEAYLVSENIPVPNDESVMIVSIEKDFHSTRGGPGYDKTKSIEINIPGKTDAFKIKKFALDFVRNDKFEYEQILIVKTSLEAKSEDIAKNLKLALLPRQKEKNDDLNQYHNWSVGDITPEILNNSKPIKFEVIASEHETSKIHSFKIQAPPQFYLFAEIRKGLHAMDEYELMQDRKETLQVPEYPKKLTIMSEGSLLSLHGEKKIPLLARGITDVEFKVSKIIPSQINQLIAKVFQQSNHFAKPDIAMDSKNTMTEQFSEKMSLPVLNGSVSHYFSFDLGKYLNKGQNKKGFYYIEVTDKNNAASDQRFMLLTDLGVITKKTAFKTHDVFVQSLSTGLPVSGASVEIVGANGINLFEAKTNANGQATFPDLSQFEREKAPVAFLIRYLDDLSFLPYQYNDRQLNYSKFETSGVYEEPSKDKMIAMVFSDRGLYRPGESINFGFMVRSKNWRTSFKEVPLEWSLTDARGTVVKTEKIFSSSSELKELTIQSQDTWYTGTYTLAISLIKQKNEKEIIGSTVIRVEEFLPDQMKISTHLSNEKLQGWITPKNLKALVSLKNLFGTPAENRKIEAAMTVSPFSPNFKSLTGYKFISLNKFDEHEFHTPLSEAQTNDKGETNFDLDLDQFKSGMYRLRFESKGFDASGGRSVIAASTVIISPLEYIVGIKNTEDLSYLRKNAKAELELIAINSDLNKIKVNNVSLVTIERRYLSVLTQDNDGTYKYQSVLKEIPLDEKRITISDKGFQYKLATSKAGDYTLLVKNSHGDEVNKIDYSIVADGNLSRSLDKNAELQVVANKSSFLPGEEIEIQIKAPYSGAGLITIERDKVYAVKWFKTSTNSTIQKIKIPADLEGNAYVNVTILRGTESREVFMSPLSYAVIPFSINVDSHKSKLTLNAPTMIKPGQTIDIKFSSNRKTPIIIWGVDEGIVLISKYIQPQPIDFFFQKRALQVSTWQTLDLLMPEFSILKSVSGAGGDGSAGALGRNLNPFKRKSNPPMVFWSGVLEANEKIKEYKIHVPDYYNGNVKIYAMAATEQAYAIESAQTLVRGDFVITPTAPVSLSPGDEFEMGVGVSNQAEGTGTSAQVKVSLKTNDYFEIKDDSTKLVVIPEGHESELKFKVKVKNKLGSGNLSLTASSGNKSATYALDASVRPASPYYSDVQFAIIDKEKTEVPFDRKMYPELRVRNFSLSSSPLSLLKGFESYLAVYPYMCSEQLLSKAVPALFISANAKDLKKLQTDYAQVLEILRSRQTADGGFSLYPGGQNHLLVSIYALHYLTEARDRGLAVPDDLFKYTLEFVKNLKVENYTSISDLRLMAYALYLQTRNGIVPTNQISYLTTYLEQNFKKIWKKDDAAVFLAGIYKLVKQNETGANLIKNMQIGEAVETDYGSFYDQTVRDAHLLMITARHYPELMKNIVDNNSLKSLLTPLMKKQYNTYSSAALYFAFGSMSQISSDNQTLADLSVEQIDAQGKAYPTTKTTNGLVEIFNLGDNLTKVKVGSSLKYPVFYTATQNGFDREPKKIEYKNGLEISRVYLNDKGEEIKKVALGDTVEVHLRVRSLGDRHLQQVALVDLFPGGFELLIEKTAQNETPPEEERQQESAPIEEDGSGEPTEQQEYNDEGRFELLKLFLPTAYAQQATATRQPSTVNLGPLSPYYVDNREDRVILYTDVDKDLREYVYKLKAINIGKFTVPPAFGEDMYDRSIRYEGGASEILVEKK